jgi:hypothetical protein
MNVTFAQTNSPVPSIEVIAVRMAKARSANQARFRAYTVTRDYRLFRKNIQDAQSQVIADVSFTPPYTKTFAIRQKWGAGMGERIVRHILANEVEVANADNSEISSQNYEFRFIRLESINGRLCYLLELHPRRSDAHLLVGKAWVDAQTYLLHRMEGEPAKKPSWWIRRLHFALLYGNVGGMWLPTGLEATADVRLIGECRVVSQNVGINVGQFAENADREK